MSKFILTVALLIVCAICLPIIIQVLEPILTELVNFGASLATL